MSTQRLIEKIQKAGLTATIDIDPDSVKCSIWDKPDKDGMQAVLFAREDRLLFKAISQALHGVPKDKKGTAGKQPVKHRASG